MLYLYHDCSQYEYGQNHCNGNCALKMRLKVLLHFICVPLLLGWVGLIHAHPGDGLVVNDDNWYFVATDPIEGPEHHAALWRWSEHSGLDLVYRSPFTSSNLHLNIGLDGHLYCAERHYLGEREEKANDKPGDRDVFETRLGRLKDAQFDWLLGPTRGRRPFGASAFLVAADSSIYFADENNELKVRHPSGKIERLQFPYRFQHIANLAWGATNQIVLLDETEDNLQLFSMSPGSTIIKLAVIPKQKETGSHTLDGTIIFDLVIDKNENIYLADWGRRQIIKVSAQGAVSDFYQAANDYAPEGLALIHGDIALFESSHPRTYDKIFPRLLRVDPNGKATRVYDFAAEHKEE